MKHILILLLIFVTQTFASTPKAATVIMLKGKAAQKLGDKPVWLKEGDTVEEGAFVTTAANSFIKLMMSDQTQISLGPDSSIRVEESIEGEPGLVSINQGQIRAKVQKDPLLDKTLGGKSKFLLRTRSATMGVRGTEFQIVFNPENQVTSTVTFDGGVAMAKTDPAEVDQMSRKELAEKVLTSDKAVLITEGNFSSSNPSLSGASVPTKISPAQFESLKNSSTLISGLNSGLTSSVSSTSKAPTQEYRSPFPPGADPKSFIGSGSGLEKQLGENVGNKDAFQPKAPSFDSKPDRSPPPAEGFYNKDTGAYAPPAGGFIDFKSGLYVPPPPGSLFDKNTGVYVPPPVLGGFDSKSGQYVPPPGVQLDPNKGFIFTQGPGDRPGGEGAPKGIMGYADPKQHIDNIAGPRFDNGFGNAQDHPGFGPDGNRLPPPLPPRGFQNFVQPQFPGNDPFCPNCGSANLPPLPPPGTTTKINFTITVQ